MKIFLFSNFFVYRIKCVLSIFKGLSDRHLISEKK